ncbi:hypothetical protein [Vagococcus xieshaowenii]|uniref:Uncharacterized protein n=1 Tax=Vagococcus xieshaowenii TaxID=2562451 RepID=A0A4Z0D7U7_9ENTE|nr:hypothetical protein [Vagococcus xieshaowenii]QCA29077.1 hypothetical protein E4Z98_07030 [Vagococcus xieshaowenii]TFZ40947.1 hypothetical protein E4031_06065 [Vagococcus xieshaowenii]
MHQSFVEIVVDRVKSQYVTEKMFYEDYLLINQEQWQSWKQGALTLSAENNQKIKLLFSDYEWMLIQKLIRQAGLFPEKRNYVVSEYKRLKSLIAQKWLQTDEAKIELITQKSHIGRKKTTQNSSSRFEIRVSLEYGVWGMDDILIFHLPATIQQQIESSPIDLLDWVSENLTESYLDTNQEG